MEREPSDGGQCGLDDSLPSDLQRLRCATCEAQVESTADEPRATVADLAWCDVVLELRRRVAPSTWNTQIHVGVEIEVEVESVVISHFHMTPEATTHAWFMVERRADESLWDYASPYQSFFFIVRQL